MAAEKDEAVTEEMAEALRAAAAVRASKLSAGGSGRGKLGEVVSEEGVDISLFLDEVGLDDDGEEYIPGDSDEEYYDDEDDEEDYEEDR